MAGPHFRVSAILPLDFYSALDIRNVDRILGLSTQDSFVSDLQRQLEFSGSHVAEVQDTALAGDRGESMRMETDQRPPLAC